MNLIGARERLWDLNAMDVGNVDDDFGYNVRRGRGQQGNEVLQVCDFTAS